MKLAFLFGAGVSLSCQAPSTQRLTEIILKGQSVHRHTDCTYIVSDSYSGVEYPGDLDQIKCFLRFLQSHANSFFQQEKKRDRKANYEDLYYLASQLADAVDEYENPAISGFLEESRGQFVEREGFKLFDETRNYIKGVICHYLFSLQPVSRHLEQIVEAAKDASVSNVEVFTLNHDLLIEAVLDKAGIQYEDGFVPAADDLRRWDGQKFATSLAKVRLSKLHGSVNWHPVRFSSSEASCVCIGPYGNITLESALCPGDPAILIGTFNKMLDYTIGIHADLFCAFQAALAEVDGLVVSGYSFGDKGINASVARWIRANPCRRLLIVAPHASQYSRTARGEVRSLFTRVPERIETMDSEFENVSWQEMHNKVVQKKI